MTKFQQMDVWMISGPLACEVDITNMQWSELSCRADLQIVTHITNVSYMHIPILNGKTLYPNMGGSVGIWNTTPIPLDHIDL